MSYLENITKEEADKLFKKDVRDNIAVTLGSFLGLTGISYVVVYNSDSGGGLIGAALLAAAGAAVAFTGAVETVKNIHHYRKDPASYMKSNYLKKLED